MLYQINITSRDSLGLNMVESIVEMANLGATLKTDAMPRLSFPHHCTMLLEAEVPPTPSATVRVFEYGTNKEIFESFSETKQEAATFSMDVNDDDLKDTTIVDTGPVVPLTKEQLDALNWKTEFKEVCKLAGITGRDREQMTKEYLAKYA